MKKNLIFLAAAAAVLALSSCEQNTQPRYQKATEFVLNTPALASQYYQLTPEGTIDMTWSQPDWGFSAAGEYTVEMSLDKGFAGEAYTVTPDPVKGCTAQISMEQVAIGLCTLRGITKEEQYVDEPAGAVYFRVIGQLPGISGSQITSNVIELTQVKGYCAVQSPGKIYLVGAPEGWKGPDPGQAAHYAEWALYEPDDNIGCKIYSGSFMIPADNAMFRFYTALTGWDADSWGSQEEDNPLEFSFTDNEFTYTLVKGKGAFSFPGWTTDGTMDMTINMNDHSLIIKATPAE